MNKLVYFLFLTIFIVSCDDVLNVSPKSIVTTSNMWEDELDAEGAMYGLYRQFRNVSDENMFLWGDIRTGFYTRGLALRNPELHENRVNPSSSGTNWAGLYRTINDANLILKYVPEIDFTSETKKNEILANAYFIRAISYYYIARVWGDAPLPLKGFESAEQEGIFPSREPVSGILDQVDSDIGSALDHIPDSSKDILFASKASINMLKADYNLWMAKVHDGGNNHLDIAKAAVDEVLLDGYSLLDDYETVFRTKENDEIIFSIRFEKDDGPGNYIAAQFLYGVQHVPPPLVFDPIPVGGHAHRYHMTEEHEKFIHEDPNDSRAMVNYSVYEFNGERFSWVNKFVGDFEDGTAHTNADILVYRYAEALLFKAEIENSLGNQSEALSYVNMVAERAYGQEDYYSGSYSQEELDNIILNERLKELQIEGKAWFDLIRFDRVFERVWSLQGREDEQNVLLWPVSFSSLNRNTNLEQTPGY